MTTIEATDIRVSQQTKTEKKDRVVRTNLKFLRRTAGMRISIGSKKEDLVHEIWSLYFRMKRNGLIAAPRATRSALREKYGIWTQVNVERTH